MAASTTVLRCLRSIAGKRSIDEQAVDRHQDQRCEILRIETEQGHGHRRNSIHRKRTEQAQISSNSTTNADGVTAFQPFFRRRTRSTQSSLFWAEIQMNSKSLSTMSPEI